MRSILKITLIGLLVSFTACGDSGKPQTKIKKYKYICLMDPQVGSDKPGICPRCGMELVERDTTEDK